MTTTQKSTVTTIQIRRGAKTALSISHDYTALATSTLPSVQTLQLLTDQAIQQWWHGLNNFQKLSVGEQELNLKISASFQQPQKE